MSGLSVITFSKQQNKVPQKISTKDADVNNVDDFIHECEEGFNDSVYMFLHNTTDSVVPVKIYQSTFPHTEKTLFKFIQVDPAGEPFQLVFNGFTLFAKQRLYLTCAELQQEDAIVATGYVKRFAV